VDTAERYRLFAEWEAAGSSPCYERLSYAVADEPALIERLDGLPKLKRQPNLLFAACRYLGDSLEDTAEALSFMLDRWEDIADVLRVRSTQTNEPARTGALLPLLAQLEQPIALIEVGTSAGLCLYPDRYRITYDDQPPIGPRDAKVSIHVSTNGAVPIPEVELEVADRIGIDLNPLDVRRADDLAWLKACIWPEHDERRARLTAAAATVADDPPEILAGNLLDRIDDALARVPPDTVPVVFHTAVLAYLARDDRQRFADSIDRHRAGDHRRVVWISNEAPGVVDGLTTDLEPPPQVERKGFFVLGVNGTEPCAVADPHGEWLAWGPEESDRTCGVTVARNSRRLGPDSAE
jgi:hypothetical protein